MPSDFRRRLEDALVDAAVLEELCDDPGLPVDELARRVLDLGAFAPRVDAAHVEDRVRALADEGDLTEVDGRVRLTDDGLDDLRAAERAICCVVANEIPGAVVPDDLRGGYAALQPGP